MDISLPADAPRTTDEAFAYIGRIGPNVTVDDLKILALVEAVGKELYACLAEGTDHPEVKALLLANGREELAHAHRVGKAIEILTGEAFPIPPIEDNPVYTPLAPMAVTRASLHKLAEGERNGETMYERIAASFDDAEAITLFRLNGKEELEHGARLQRAADLLDA